MAFAKDEKGHTLASAVTPTYLAGFAEQQVREYIREGNKLAHFQCYTTIDALGRMVVRTSHDDRVFLIERDLHSDNIRMCVYHQVDMRIL